MRDPDPRSKTIRLLGKSYIVDPGWDFLQSSFNPGTEHLYVAINYLYYTHLSIYVYVTNVYIHIYIHIYTRMYIYRFMHTCIDITSVRDIWMCANGGAP